LTLLRRLRAFWLLLTPALLMGQEEDFRVYTEAPRLFLRPARLRLLKRERERQSIRWQQLDTLISGKVPMAEPALAFALYSITTGDKAYCDQAERAAGSDLRQMAIVFDWCGRPALAPRIKQAADRLSTAKDVPSIAARTMAAAAMAEADAAWSEATMKDIVNRWWRGTMVPFIKNGGSIPRPDTLALFELLIVIRDNLNLDLRDPVQGYFRDLPILHLLSYYPAAYPGPENEYRIPYYSDDGEPDLKLAARSRAAELAMVAYDNNAVESQSLQSWLLLDRFLMRGTYGIVYEFLWANPYQPGITFHHLPNVFHDKRSGRLYLRSTWEEDATFFIYDRGKGQVFDAGKRADVNIAAQKKPIRIGWASVVLGAPQMQIETGYSVAERGDQPLEPGEKRPEETWFLVGLPPNTRFDIEPDDEEMYEARTDMGGILELHYIKPRPLKVRIRQTPGQP
jgi:hypothetical protein